MHDGVMDLRVEGFPGTHHGLEALLGQGVEQKCSSLLKRLGLLGGVRPRDKVGLGQLQSVKDGEKARDDRRCTGSACLFGPLEGPTTEIFEVRLCALSQLKHVVTLLGQDRELIELNLNLVRNCFIHLGGVGEDGLGVFDDVRGLLVTLVLGIAHFSSTISASTISSSCAPAASVPAPAAPSP